MGIYVENPCATCPVVPESPPTLYHVKAVEDYCRYAGRDEEAHEEEEYAQHPRAQAVASAAGKFLRYGGMRHAPAYKQRGDKGAKGQQYVGGQRIEVVEQRAAEEAHGAGSHGERAQYAYDAAESRDDARCLAARGLQLFRQQ